MTGNATASVSRRTARDLLVDLVSIPSPTGEEDRAAARLAAFFEDHGRAVEIDEVGNVRARADDRLLLTSHVDTVPGELPVRLDADGDTAVLHGRGSVDATGSLAAMAVVAVRAGVSFAGVVAEETDSRGARHLVRTRDAPDALVNGEPSGWDGTALGYRGYQSGRYVATSTGAHTARPEPNAIEDALAWFRAFRASLAPADEDRERFERATATPVDVDGGPTDDGRSVRASLTVECRIPPGGTPAAVRSAAEEALCDGTDASLLWDEPIPPVLVSPRTPLARAFRRAIRESGGEPTLLCKTGTCDMNVYADAWDCPMATYGPGDAALDHRPDERLPIPEYRRAIEVLETVAEEI